MIYVTYHSTAEDVRVCSPAANTKVETIAEALERNGINVEIISTCQRATVQGPIPSRTYKLGKLVRCLQTPFYSSNSRLIRILQNIFCNLFLFFFLLVYAKKNEIVLFYHAIERGFAVIFAKRLKGFKLLLEVEEVYADALPLSPRQKKIENKLFSCADAFIFSSSLLDEQINKFRKPSAIVHGTYKVVAQTCQKFNDGKIHILYAGTLDMRKGGAKAAVETAGMLPENYHIHILGFGKEQEIELIKSLIDEVNALNCASVSYDGCLAGEAFTNFAQKCHIGLSTQNPNDVFNASSFPSKILSYLANGLQVISAKIPAVEHSKVGDIVHYYSQQTPQEISRAIRSVKVESKDKGRERIIFLHDEFINNISILISSIKL